MLKVVKGDRPSRPPSGFSETLWYLLVATWAEQYAREPRKRPSARTVLNRLAKCTDHWGKSITPLIPEDWENTGLCHVSPNDYGAFFMTLLQTQKMIPHSRRVFFGVVLAILVLTRDLNDLVFSQTEPAVLLSQLDCPARLKHSGSLGMSSRCVLAGNSLS